MTRCSNVNCGAHKMTGFSRWDSVTVTLSVYDDDETIFPDCFSLSQNLFFVVNRDCINYFSYLCVYYTHIQCSLFSIHYSMLTIHRMKSSVAQNAIVKICLDIFVIETE